MLTSQNPWFFTMISSCLQHQLILHVFTDPEYNFLCSYKMLLCTTVLWDCQVGINETPSLEFLLEKSYRFVDMRFL